MVLLSEICIMYYGTVTKLCFAFKMVLLRSLSGEKRGSAAPRHAGHGERGCASLPMATVIRATGAGARCRLRRKRPVDQCIQRPISAVQSRLGAFAEGDLSSSDLRLYVDGAELLPCRCDAEPARLPIA